MTGVLVVAATAREAAHVPESLPLVITGLGKTAAATAVARALAEAGTTDLTVVNVGTAGALRDGVTGLYVVGTVVNHDMNADAIRALGHDPQEQIVVGPQETVLASGAAFDVPVRLVKHVSDNADDDAVNWPAQVEASARALGAWLRANL